MASRRARRQPWLRCRDGSVEKWMNTAVALGTQMEFSKNEEDHLDGDDSVMAHSLSACPSWAHLKAGVVWP